MSAAPRVSVVTIFRDAERFLAEAIASVEAQSIADWELLLVDDGSTDGGSALARASAARDPARIRCLEHPAHANLGMSASRNLGIAAARAPLVAFLDADDLFLPTRLERHLAILEARPQVDMVQSDSIHWLAPADDRGPGLELRHLRGVWADGEVIEPPAALSALLMLPSFSVPICDITVRRETALALGGFEAGFRALCEDRVFLTKVYAARRVAVHAELLAKVRSHRGSCTQRIQLGAHLPDGDYQRGIAAYRRWVGEHILRQRVADPALRALAARWAAGDEGAAARGRFMMLRVRAFDWLERHAPRPLHHAVVRFYHASVRAYTLLLARRLRRPGA